jgi:hypothetical protein
VIVTCEESGHDYMIIIRLILNRFNIGSYLYWNIYLEWELNQNVLFNRSVERGNTKRFMPYY